MLLLFLLKTSHNIANTWECYTHVRFIDYLHVNVNAISYCVNSFIFMKLQEIMAGIISAKDMHFGLVKLSIKTFSLSWAWKLFQFTVSWKVFCIRNEKRRNLTASLADRRILCVWPEYRYAPFQLFIILSSFCYMFTFCLCNFLFSSQLLITSSDRAKKKTLSIQISL